METIEPDKNKGGRPTLYNPDLAAKICNLLSGGIGRTDAAGTAGITYQTLLNWIHAHPAFKEDVEVAEAKAGAFFSNVVLKAVKGEIDTAEVVVLRDADGAEHYEVVKLKVAQDPKMALAWLKAHRQEEWSEKKIIEHSGSISGGLSLDDIPEDELDRRIADAEARKAAAPVSEES